MALFEIKNHIFRLGVDQNPVFLHVWILLLLVFGNTIVDASLQACPSAPTSTISSPCKFSPGEHSYQSLIISSDVFFETTLASSRHTLKVTQTLEIQRTGTLSAGLNEESSNHGGGVGHSRGGTGGSFGGRGGAASGMTLASSQALPYGHPFNVSTPGSRGGGSGRGNGGGFLQLEARKIILNGIVMAPGGSATGNGGGGSGGGIAVFCFEIEGTGKIEANGGIGSGTGGGGSGGRMSITYRQGTFRLKTHTYGGKIGKNYDTSFD